MYPDKWGKYVKEVPLVVLMVCSCLEGGFMVCNDVRRYIVFISVFVSSLLFTVAYRGGGWGFKPSPEIPKALQNGAKLNPIVKTVKNC